MSAQTDPRHFGVNLVRIAPGSISSIRHCHAV